MFAATLPVGAQPPRVIRIGRLSPLTPTTEAPFMDAFRKGLQELGWLEGQHYTISSRPSRRSRASARERSWC